MDALTVLFYLLSGLLVVAGLLGVVVPALPGVPLLFAGLWLAAWAGDYLQVGGWTLGGLAVLALLAVILDMLAGLLGAKRVRASAQAIWGALCGSVVGLFFGLPGLIIGPFLGAVIGELMARQGLSRATEVGLATWVGLLLGTVAKLAISLAMLTIFILAWIF